MKNHQHSKNYKANSFHLAIKRRSDKLMNYFLPSYFVLGLVLAAFYNTWAIAIGVGGFSLLAYYAIKYLLPKSLAYQYVLSAILGVFMAQFIFQLHGVFEIYFFAFIGSAVLITYQKWTLQIPILIVVIVHHIVFSYLQNNGFSSVSFDLQAFTLHILLTIVIFFICGLCAYQISNFSKMHITQKLRMINLKKEAQLSIERKNHAEELRKLNDNLELKAKELSHSNAELEQFAYVASHDLQEPLRTITSFLKLLEQKYKAILDEKGKQYIHFAIDGAQRMKQIIQDLLEFSKAEKKGDKREEIDLQQLVTSITSLYKNQITEQQALIIFKNLPVIKAYKAPIRQVFQNLIDNAIKYQKTGVTPLVNITFKETEKHWQFSVIDNGIGIKKEHFDEIFVIFKRLHGNSAYTGTGIGLAITKKIVEFLGGKIWVESEEGKGTTFNFTIIKS